MRPSAKLEKIQHGSRQKREQGPPKKAMMIQGSGFYAFQVPPHVIDLKLNCVDNFMVMQLGHSRALGSFNSDRLKPIQLGPGYPVIGRTGSEFNCKATSTAGVIGFHFTDTYLKKTLIDHKGLRQFSFNISRPRFDLHLLQLFHLISQALTQSPPDLLYIDYLLAASITRSMSVYRGEPVQSVKKVPMDRLARAEDYIRAYFNTPLSLNRIARTAGLSPYYFARSFRAHFGISPHQYLQRVRLEKSLELLETTDWAIDCIALEVGFSSHSNFGSFFKKQTGLTPGAFRELFK